MAANTDTRRGRWIDLLAMTAGLAAFAAAAALTNGLDFLTAFALSLAALMAAYFVAFRALAGRLPRLRNEPIASQASEALTRRWAVWLVVNFVIFLVGDVTLGRENQLSRGLLSLTASLVATVVVIWLPDLTVPSGLARLLAHFPGRRTPEPTNADPATHRRTRDKLLSRQALKDEG